MKTLTAAELETLRRIYDEVRYALRKGTALQMGLRELSSDAAEAAEARVLCDQFYELAKRLRLACSVKSCDAPAVRVGGKCWHCTPTVE